MIVSDGEFPPYRIKSNGEYKQCKGMKNKNMHFANITRVKIMFDHDSSNENRK